MMSHLEVDRRLPQLRRPLPHEFPQTGSQGIHRMQIIGCIPILPVMIAPRAPAAAPVFPDINSSIPSRLIDDVWRVWFPQPRKPRKVVSPKVYPTCSQNPDCRLHVPSSVTCFRSQMCRRVRAGNPKISDGHAGHDDACAGYAGRFMQRHFF
jgi:hypothetical protein